MTINGYYTTEIGLRRELGDSGQLFQAVSQGLRSSRASGVIWCFRRIG